MSKKRTNTGTALTTAEDEAAISKLADPDEVFELYRRMSEIRAVELRIESLHKRGRMSGSFHSSMGQEGCAVGVCAALRNEDVVTSTHRGHGHAIAKGVPVEGIFAELFGRESGVSGGRGGSMHLHHRESGFYGENAIVAGGLPWAGGIAWARKRRGRDDVAVAFIGDGGFAQGVSHEILLMARYWDTPLIVVCENNGLAHSMASQDLFGEPGSITAAVEATGIMSRFVDGRDVIGVADEMREVVASVREGRPAFVECEVFRVRPHSLSDPDYLYRPKDAGEEWLVGNDPVARLRQRLADFDSERTDRVDSEVEAFVDAACDRAESDPATPTTNATRNVYATSGLGING